LINANDAKKFTEAVVQQTLQKVEEAKVVLIDEKVENIVD